MPLDLNQLYDRQQLATWIRNDIDTYSLTFDDGPRRHLGASLIGSPCERYLWFVFRWMFHKIADPRMYRLWQRGHREEDWLWAMLRACGWTVLDRDPATGEQWRVSAVEGHLGGSLDAIGKPPAHYGIDEWFLLECKTNKTGPKWTALESQLIESQKPLHWAQACIYGYLKGIRGLVYFNANKDDDRLHLEVRTLDYEHAQREIAKGEFVILSQTPPAKLHQNAAHYDCKYCDAVDVCHKGAAVLVNCRSCAYATPTHNKQWYCSGHRGIIPEDTIKIGCANYTPLVH